MVTEIVEGMSVREYVGQRGGLDESSLHQLAVVSAAALASLHEAGYVHGDLGPDTIVFGPDGPRMVSVRPLLQDQPARPAADGESDDRLSPGQARDVFAWAVTMVFAAGGSLGPGVPGRGDDDMPGIAGQQAVPVSMRAVLRECLSEPRYRPSARRVLQWMSRGQFPIGGYRVDADGYLVGGDGYAVGGGGYPVGGDGYPVPPVWSDAPVAYGSVPGGGAGQGADHAAFATRPISTARASESWSESWSGAEPAAPTVAIGPQSAGPEAMERTGHTGRGLRPTGGGLARSGGARPAAGVAGRFSGRTLVLSVLALVAVAAATGGGRRDLNALFQTLTGRQATTTATTAGAATAGTQANQATQATPSAIPSAAPAATPSAIPSAAATAAPTATPGGLTGQWQGTLTQSDSPNPLPARLILRGNGGQIILPTIGCTGNLTVQTSTQGRTVFLDRLAADAGGRCAPSGTVTVSAASATTLQLRWVNNAAPFNSAQGVLQKS